ncbi:MAG: sugar phosphate isomerase/epimerase family protein [Spirochaetota bacterium]
MKNNYPKLHNATWPGVVGKGPDAEEDFIDLDTMIELTAQAEVDGVKFDGIDLFLSSPHVDINSRDDDLKRLADKVTSKNLDIGSLVAPVWDAGSAMGSPEERREYLEVIKKACNIAKRLRELGIRPGGVIRIDSSDNPENWSKDPEGNTRRIAETFGTACDIAEDYGEKLAAEGEICWGGMHSWKKVIHLLEMVDRPDTIGFQADMAHTLLFLLGYNAPEDALLPEDFDWKDQQKFEEAYKTITDALRPWTIDFHVAQNDATVFGSGSHDKTGHHCLPNDPNGKLDIVWAAGFWLRENGQVTRKIQHICWDGCMFPNQVMMKPQTWKEILSVMLQVREAHGWTEQE